MAQPHECPLCARYERQTPNSFSCDIDNNRDAYWIDCGRCGHFGVTRELFEDSDGIRKASDSKLLVLSQLARRQTAETRKLLLSWDNWASFDRAERPPTALAYYEMVLLELASRCRYPGVTISPFRLAESAAKLGIPTLVAQDIAKQLMQARLLELPNAQVGEFSARLTVEGWERADKLTFRRDPSRRAFVAMWFDASMTPAYNAIAAMLEQDGYRPPFRVDDPAHDELPEAERHSRIDDRILAEIRGSRFVIADFTGNRQAVYYEAGFADGLGIPVVWCCKDGPDFKALNFDTRQHEHIKWSDETDFVQQLRAKIRRHGWSWTR